MDIKYRNTNRITIVNLNICVYVYLSRRSVSPICEL